MSGHDGTSGWFTDAVTLTPAEPERGDLAFTATTQPCPWPKAYGGDLVAPEHLVEPLVRSHLYIRAQQLLCGNLTERSFFTGKEVPSGFAATVLGFLGARALSFLAGGAGRVFFIFKAVEAWVRTLIDDSGRMVRDVLGLGIAPAPSLAISVDVPLNCRVAPEPLGIGNSGRPSRQIWHLSPDFCQNAETAAFKFYFKF